MESGLIFNQLICEFESRHPCQSFRANAECDYISKNVSSRSITCRPSVWVVAQLAEHRTVTAAREGSTPFGPPKPNSALGKVGSSHLILNQEIVGSNPTRAANFQTELWPRGEAPDCRSGR